MTGIIIKPQKGKTRKEKQEKIVSLFDGMERMGGSEGL
jgi:hypothetical protein